MLNLRKYAIWCVGRLLYPIRGHDSFQFIESPAFADVPEPNMTLECDECGPSGSKLLLCHTSVGLDGKGTIPHLRWTPPTGKQPKEYVLIAEDLDLPIPFLVVHHGLFWGIPADRTEITSLSVDMPPHGEPWMTRGSYCVPNLRGSAYIGASPIYGHGTHRYVFTIVALNEQLKFDDPGKVTKADIKKALIGKVIGWGQWVGKFEKTLSY